MNTPRMQAALETLYGQYNQRRWVSPDPLQFLYDFPDVADREIVGLIASSLAYGRVAQILKSIANALCRMKGDPARYLKGRSDRLLRQDFSGFKHRFTTAGDMVRLLTNVREIVSTHGSLNAGFCVGLEAGDSTVAAALGKFSAALGGGYLVPSPVDGSACKRLNLYLRWMVRKDEVDPGGWEGVKAGQLIVPLDVHMGRIARSFRLTRRKPLDFKTALDITGSFQKFAPDDPIRYDFVLTRFGIRSDMPPPPRLRMR